MRKVLHRFARDRGGNFALMTSIMAMPLLLGIGMALDYSTISRTRADLQNSLDAAVLSVAREGKDVSDDKAREIAELFVAQNSRLKVTDLQVHHDGTAFSVTGVTNAPIAFGGLFGYKAWPVAAASSADIAYASYEVGLVLDTTGSMAGGKLAAMKDAVNGLIDGMSKQVNDTDKLKFALVPFSSFVNVGRGFGPSFDKSGKQIDGTGAAWLDLKGASPIKQSELGTGASRFQLNANMGQKWSGCVETREPGGNDYDVSDAPADPAKPETLFVPAFAIDEPDSGGYINNYINSGAKPNDPSAAQKIARWNKYGVRTDAAGNPLNGGLLDLVWAVLKGLLLTGGSNPTIAISTHAVNGYGQTGPGFGCVSQPITALSSDYAALKTKVEALKAQGNTNIMEGVAWGMRVLSPGEPFSQGADPKKNANLEKIMIVLTDGTNVFGNTGNALGSTYSSLGYLVDGRLGITAGGSSSTTPLMNDRTLAACTNAKAQGIEVYTIRLEEPNVATGTLLKECASVPENYFDVPSRSQLDEAFGKIKERIARVRISS
jgi:Flp pilus assembly protein TadG